MAHINFPKGKKTLLFGGKITVSRKAPDSCSMQLHLSPVGTKY